MMRRVYVVLVFFFLLFFVGCEKEEFPSGVQSHRQPEGFVQSRVDDDGVRHVALIVAPKRPGERPPDLSSLKGIDFLERSRPEVRARLDPDRVPRYPGFAFYRPGTYLLSSPFSVSIYPGEYGFLTNDPEHEDPYVYSSDYYILYDLYSQQEEQELTFSRGDIEGKVFLRRDGGALYARFNDEPGESRIFHGGGSSNPTARISFVLPLGFFRGLDRETLNRYVGEWTVSGNPELPPFGINGPGTGGTPFSFDIRAFIVDEISGAYRPDIPVPDSDETVSGGATFRAVAKTLADGPDGVEGNLHWKAVVLPPGGGDTIRTLYGQSGTYSPGGTGIEVNWDGKNESGQTVPGGKKYGVNISAVVTENTPPQPIRGRVWHNAFGPPEANVNPYNIEISPNPYIPYTHEEMHFEIDEDGFPVWPDDDGDGYPDRFPDHDGDGYPDFNPGEEPPGIHFYADPNRGGYETTWTAEVVSEEGEVLHTESSPRTNAEVDFEWMPPAELEPQTLKLRVSATQCQRRKVEVGVLGRGTGGGCESFAFEGEVAFNPVGALEIFSGGLIATSEDSLKVSSDPGEDLATKNRLGKVHPEGEWTLEVRDLQFAASHKPWELTAQLNGLSSQKNDTIELYRQDNGRETKYVGHFNFPDTFKVPSGLQPVKTGFSFVDAVLVDKTILVDDIYEGQPIQRRVTLENDVYASSGNIMATMVAGVQSIAVQLVDTAGYILTSYATPRRQFGSFTPFRAKEATPDFVTLSPDEAYASLENVKSFGFDTIEVIVGKAENPDLRGDLKAYVKVKRSSELFVSFAHGARTGQLILDQKKHEYLTPSDLIGTDLSQVKTWVMASCNVLDMHDYNNNRIKEPSSGRTGPDDPVSLRRNTGSDWWLATGKGNVILLGYNHPTLAGFATQAMSRFGAEMQRLRAAGISDERIQQYAWLSANLALGKGQNLNACAWDKEYYYFISYYPPIWVVPKPDEPFAREVHGVYKIPLDAMGENVQVSWTTQEDGPAGAIKVNELDIQE